MKLLFKNLRCYSQGRDVFSDLRLANGKILECGRGLSGRRGERVLDFSGFLALPGLINSHDHLELNLYPRLGTPPYPNFYAWAQAIYRPDRPPISTIEKVPLADRLWWGAYKNLVSGATTVVHHNPYYSRIFGARFPVKVLKRYSWAHSLGFGNGLRNRFRKSRGRPFILHAAEGTDDGSAREIEKLHELGVLFQNTVLVHGVAINREHIEMLQKCGTKLVWCPGSNLHLYGRTAAIDQLKRRLQVALGTDSTLSGSPTLFDELRVAQKTELATPKELLDMVTGRAASIFGLTDGRGTLGPQAPADLVLLPDQGEFVADTLLAATPARVAAVLIDGEPRLSDVTWAEAFRLDEKPVTIDGVAKCVYGSLADLRTRISTMVEPKTLSHNPLWSQILGAVKSRE